MEIRDNDLLWWLGKKKREFDKCDKGKYCLFHRNRGHATHNCFDLKENIEGIDSIWLS